MDNLIRVVIETAMGEIVADLDAQRAPGTVANFLRYVDGAYYEEGRVHRTVTLQNQPNNAVKIEVIQAGINPKFDEEKFAPVPLERTTVTGLRHLDGTISMARLTPDSAQSDFFICIGDQPELDFAGARNPDGQGFAAFGTVIAGMDVVRRIQNAPHVEQRLTPPIIIRGIRRA